MIAIPNIEKPKDAEYFSIIFYSRKATYCKERIMDIDRLIEIDEPKRGKWINEPYNLGYKQGYEDAVEEATRKLHVILEGTDATNGNDN